MCVCVCVALRDKMRIGPCLNSDWATCELPAAVAVAVSVERSL